MSQRTPASLSTRTLTLFLHKKIPLTRAMGVTVKETGARLVLEAPLRPNLNHLGTAFGGSLHTLAILAGYAALWTLLREAGLDGHVVVKQSSAHYRQPVKGRLRAVCLRPPLATAVDFLDDLRRHRKARMELEAVIEGAGRKPAVEFAGTFVALL